MSLRKTILENSIKWLVEHGVDTMESQLAVGAGIIVLAVLVFIIYHHFFGDDDMSGL